MIPIRQIARLSHLAAKFVGGADVHVVDPLVDLRSIFEKKEDLSRSVEERRLKIELPNVEAEYNEWYKAYEAWKSVDPKSDQISELKKEMRSKKSGLIGALSLPNFVHNVGKEERKMLKPTKHAQYLAQQGLLRIDKNNHVVHLAGFPAVVQKMLKNQILELFPQATLMSPSHFVRAAILEALNVDANNFIPFTDGSSSFPLTYLVGNSLASLCSPFLKSSFTDKNEWPIRVQSIGAAYHEKKNSVDLVYGRQRLKHCALLMSKTEPELDEFISSSVTSVASLLLEGLHLEVHARVVKGKELRNYESQAVVVECNGLELVRASRIGDYISRRLNICHAGATPEESGFVHMAYVETDIDRVIARLVDNLVEGKEPPRGFRDVVKQSL
ncbi:unnamed protein product [Caenorhabditis auriculariae]|uniref:Uncharacterized protein n=1 Tax=Caenorhabditis auriculariae TaxID=2777116 RepID=A0A8S1H1Z6_9PELO|nr:unnamed protein product [Caenorhabditis auriculariae]